jgi:hypothetical protein
MLSLRISKTKSKASGSSRLNLFSCVVIFFTVRRQTKTSG